MHTTVLAIVLIFFCETVYPRNRWRVANTNTWLSECGKKRTVCFLLNLRGLSQTTFLQEKVGTQPKNVNFYKVETVNERG